MRFLFSTTLALLMIFLFGCGSSEKDNSGPVAKEVELATKVNDPENDSLVISYSGRDGVSAFDLLLENHNVEFIESAVGNFVKSIDSIEINNDYSWLYSINDQMGMQASDKYITSDSDTIRWHYRKQ